MKSLYFILYITLFQLSGCLDFGKDFETMEPTEEQVKNLKERLYLNRSLKIIPLGYKYLGSGIDGALWFKFETNEKEVNKIFRPGVFDFKLLDGEINFSNISANPKWWDIENKALRGGSVELPNVKYMSVGIEMFEEKTKVYIFWHET